uniref:HUA2-like protein 3 isoform X3 n=1 Tax=Rhizophora mucronata TaxID=61149 RepID=A0A2P2LKJ2_RHIMU
MLSLKTKVDESTSSHSEASGDFLICLLLCKDARIKLVDASPACLLASLDGVARFCNLQESNNDKLLDLSGADPFCSLTRFLERKLPDRFLEVYIAMVGFPVATTSLMACSNNDSLTCKELICATSTALSICRQGLFLSTAVA